MLRVERVNVSIAGTQILRDVSIELTPGSMTGLIGRNGAGKTTLMKTIMGILKAASGAIAFEKRTCSPSTPMSGRGWGLATCPRTGASFPISRWKRTSSCRHGRRRRPGRASGWKRHYLHSEAREFAPRKGLELSGGQQKLAALARALMSGTRFLLLDDPRRRGAGAARRLAQVIGDLRREGMAVMMTESDLQHLERLVDRVIAIDRGVIKAVR